MTNRNCSRTRYVLPDAVVRAYEKSNKTIDSNRAALTRTAHSTQGARLHSNPVLPYNAVHIGCASEVLCSTHSSA